MNRYIRQITLPQIGEDGQKKLSSAKVLIVGAGGLGSPAALYLAGAGVGTIGIVDNDVVAIENLHRQILHDNNKIGKLKTDSARETISRFNPEISIKTYNEQLTDKNAKEIFEKFDIIIDAVDNFETRYVANRACVKLQIPYVHGSVLRFTGQVGVFNCSNPSLPPFSKGGSGGGIAPCYSCIFPEPPPIDIAPSGREAGIIGMLPGIIGTIEALETIKLILKIGESLAGKLLIFDGLTCKMKTLELKKDPICKICSDGRPGKLNPT